MSLFFLIDQTSHVVKTNYCTLYKQPVNKDRLVLVRFYNADMPESRKIVISMNGVGAVLSGIK